MSPGAYCGMHQESVSLGAEEPPFREHIFRCHVDASQQLHDEASASAAFLKSLTLLGFSVRHPTWTRRDGE